MKLPKTRKKTAQNIKKLQENKSVIPNLFKNQFQQHFNGIKYIREDGVMEIYYVGIIDVLIQYMTKKQFEGFVKKLANPGEEASVVQPTYYAQRFFNFMREIVSKPPSEQAESSSEEQENVGPQDLPEPGSGDIIRPAGEPEPREKRVSSVVSTTGSTRDPRKNLARGSDRLSKTLDKNSSAPDRKD